MRGRTQTVRITVADREVGQATRVPLVKINKPKGK